MTAETPGKPSPNGPSTHSPLPSKLTGGVAHRRQDESEHRVNVPPPDAPPAKESTAHATRLAAVVDRMHKLLSGWYTVVTLPAQPGRMYHD